MSYVATATPAPPPPSWIDRAAYPFTSRYLNLAEGRLHYVDEGTGPVLVFVHGTPTWSFLYRRLIGELSAHYRCVALDHLGFGLSDKPPGGLYRPEDHARNFRALLEHLELQDVTLVVHDFGGPIGLSYAVDKPENVRALVLFNTWMWSLAGEASLERLGGLIRGPVGRLLYTRLNVSPRLLMKTLLGDRSKLGRETHRHYIDAFPSPRERQAPWVLAQELLGSSAWYEGLWSQREELRDKPALLLWGLKDPAFGERYLERWRELFTNAEVRTFSAAGHFVQEEEEGLAELIHGFMARRRGGVSG